MASTTPSKRYRRPERPGVEGAYRWPQGHPRSGPNRCRPLPGDGGKRGAAGDHTRHGPEIRQNRPRAHPDRRRRISPRSPARAGPARRGRGQGGSHHGIEGRSAQNPCCRLGRKIGYAPRSQFCSELAERVGFEPTVPIRHNGFRDRPDRPLWHLSGAAAYRDRLPWPQPGSVTSLPAQHMHGGAAQRVHAVAAG